MEDQIIAAENAKSISAEICQWSGAVFGILFGLGFFLAEVQKNDLKSLPWWKPISALVAGAAFQLMVAMLLVTKGQQN